MFIKRLFSILLILTIAVSLLAGCKVNGTSSSMEVETESADTEPPTVGNTKIEDDAVITVGDPAVSTDLTPESSGVLVKEDDKAAIDYSNTQDGYVMVRYTASTSKKLKAQVKGPGGTTYTYNIVAGDDWTTFPLSDGNGSYKVTIYENISGTRYSTVTSVSFSAEMTDEFAPFLRPNQYVNYTDSDATVTKATELSKGMTEPLEKVGAVYDFVVNNLTYDTEKAATVQSGYLPDLDAVLAAKTGICFDYAALMTAMLRSQGVPCKLVVGYAETYYHAWISVYSREQGWIDAAVYFDGNEWKRMDPTFASSGNQSESIMQYINNDSNYTAKYLY